VAERITPRSEDFAKWYGDVIQHAKLADQSPVRGCMVLRPNGFAIWESIQEDLNRRFKETGHRNAYFPMLIPESYLEREKEHVEGFAPECAVVTHGGGKKLDEPLIIRPTSETIINEMYSKWIQSYRDLPVLINQWANIVRWELRTRPFLRTLEFLWQEGHTCHETEEEAMKETLKMLDVYRTFAENLLAIPVILGQKTPSEKFAGAENTYSMETMMQDKKGLQAATSHFFGTRFAKAFNVKFQGRDNKEAYVHQTSWGISTRIIGALIMIHSDDQGLVLPPKVAPVQVVIVPILRKKSEDNGPVLEVAKKLESELSGSFRVHLDDREEHSPGFKFNEWEIQGVPFRIELGPRDLEKGICIVARRDREKSQVKLEEVAAEFPNRLSNYQTLLYDNAKEFLDRNTSQEDKYSKFKERLNGEGGFFKMHWCGSDECEATIKTETKATIRCIPFRAVREKGECIYCQKPSELRVIFGKSY